MTRTTLSIQFVLILATVIGIHGGEIPREAILTLKSDFEDGLSDREFRVDYPGVVDSTSAIIKIYKKGEKDPRVDYTLLTDAKKPQILYFELKKKDAPAGSYEVQVCSPDNECSDRREALGKIVNENKKPTLSCKELNDKEENEFERYLGKQVTKDISIPIKAGKSFLTPTQCKIMPAYSELNLKSNPAYKTIGGKNVFYAVVWYDGTPLQDLFKKINGYCGRKYIFWASAHVVEIKTKEVKRRFRGTIIVTDDLAQKYILGSEATDFPVEFARYDKEQLPKGEYYVSVSFCASDKDRINSSICSEAVYSDLKFDD